MSREHAQCGSRPTEISDLSISANGFCLGSVKVWVLLGSGVRPPGLTPSGSNSTHGHVRIKNELKVEKEIAES